MIKQNSRKYAALCCLVAVLAAVVLFFRYPAAAVLLAVMMAAGAVWCLQAVFRRRKVSRPVDMNKYGKISMAVFFTAMLLSLFMPGKSYFFVNILVCTSIAALIAGMLFYIVGSRKSDRKGKHGFLHWKAAVVAAAAVYIAGGAVLPFVYQPAVRKETEESFAAESFYGSGLSKERAKVISQNGEALEERIRLISQAEEEIILSTLEFDADISGRQVLAALIDAAGRGVKVSLLLDGFSYLTQVWWNPYFLALARMPQAEIRVYNTPQVLKPWTLMGRLHDKYLITDDTGYILGGRNTYDFFLGDQPGYKNYDWDVLVYSREEGEAASLCQVKDYFSSVWNSRDCRLIGKSMLWSWNPAISEAERELHKLYETMQEEHSDWFQKMDYETETLPVRSIRFVSNPAHILAKEPVVYYTITELMKQAKERVVFHTPYIVCNKWMLERLREVCEAVPAVQMMTNSVANNGNPFGALDYKKYKGKILETGVQILEYDGGVSYHGKCFTVDDRLSGVGSFNWDMRSAYLDTELMLVIDSEEVNRALRTEMENYEKDALQVLDENSYAFSEGQTAQELSLQRSLRIRVLGALLGWARFLM